MMTAGIVSDDPSVGQFRSIFSDSRGKADDSVNFMLIDVYRDREE